jgi:uncharacterized membrane protein
LHPRNHNTSRLFKINPVMYGWEDRTTMNPLLPIRAMHPRSIWRSIMLRPRLYYAIVAAVLALVLLPWSLASSVRDALAWNIGAAVYLAFAFRLMRNCSGDVIKTRAARQDDGRVVVLAIILAATAASLLAIVDVLALAKAAQGIAKVAYLALAGCTIFMSWTVTQIAFTFHYAHDYYNPDARIADAKNGLLFPEDDHPDYWDFFYFATSIGATSQTSDVAIRSKSLRRLVTFHAVLSFFFNTTVLALTINLAAGLI